MNRHFGPQFRDDGTVCFAIWAPSVAALVLELEGKPHDMHAEPEGWFTCVLPARAGQSYRFVLPDGTKVPDPASRAQAGDVHDASLLVDTRGFAWQHEWHGRPWHEAVIYELHAGLCGGFSGVEKLLPELRELGITAIELMPVADFPGTRNWGYDGVLPFAPDSAYGTPANLQRLVDAAHGAGLMVLLDVVYNHFGPDGNYLHAYAAPFFAADMASPWGAGIDFRRKEVRRFFIDNAIYWLREYRFDGLRLDAVHAIAEPGFLPDFAREVRAALPGRRVHLVLEHEGNKASLLERDFDAQWADDLHHCLHVLLTGESEGYYEDFQDATRLLARCLAEGFAYQGETAPHLGIKRGEPSGHLPPTSFVVCLQNHDQIGNRAMGERLAQLADADALRAATLLVVLAPFIPLLFMGEEWGSTAPFLYFTSHGEALAAAVREGRRAEFRHFAAFADPSRREAIPDPNAEASFLQSRPDRAEANQPAHAAQRRFVRTALQIRAAEIVPRIPGARSLGSIIIAPGAVLARWRLGDGAELAIALNLGAEAQEIALPPGRLLLASNAQASAHAGSLPPGSAVAVLRT